MRRCAESITVSGCMADSPALDEGASSTCRAEKAKERGLESYVLGPRCDQDAGVVWAPGRVDQGCLVEEDQKSTRWRGPEVPRRGRGSRRSVVPFTLTRLLTGQRTLSFRRTTKPCRRFPSCMDTPTRVLSFRVCSRNGWRSSWLDLERARRQAMPVE
jgi:hypothetical protein